MKFLFIDTETTGIFDFKQPADAPGQPRLAQFGMMSVDEIGADPVRLGMYIRPNGWVMSPDAEKVNGLSTKLLEERGVPVEEALSIYTSLVDAGYVVVAYNAQFDLKMMRAELRRAGWDDRFERTKNICVMRPLTNILKLPGRYGYKWPNLAEACRYFGITNEKAHDAMGDVEAAYQIFLRLHAAGLLPEAAVHYAKDRA